MQNAKLGYPGFAFCILHFAFACIFNAWNLHPLNKHSLPGKLVWQCTLPSPLLQLTPASFRIARRLPLRLLKTCVFSDFLTRHFSSSARYSVICWRNFTE